jgi:hypothetical protein
MYIYKRAGKCILAHALVHETSFIANDVSGSKCISSNTSVVLQLFFYIIG